MLTPDVNILLYAHRKDEKKHVAYREWLERLASGPEPFALSSLVAIGFLRIVTNPRIYDPPTPTGAAIAVVDALVEHPSCRMIHPGERHWSLASELARATGASGKAIADAQHAAVALEHGCTWVTRDADFAAFAPLGLRWSHLVL